MHRNHWRACLSLTAYRPVDGKGQELDSVHDLPTHDSVGGQMNPDTNPRGVERGASDRDGRDLRSDPIGNVVFDPGDSVG
jgi:hypothetical protein